MRRGIIQLHSFHALVDVVLVAVVSMGKLEAAGFRGSVAVS